MKKIYFRGGEKAKDLENLLRKGFTFKFQNIYKFQATYLNKECTVRDFHEARRTFHDLFLIAKTYFPKTTKGELAYILLNKIPNMWGNFCPATGLNVFMLNPNYTNRIYSGCTLSYKDPKGISFQMVINHAKRYEKKHVQNTDASEDKAGKVRSRSKATSEINMPLAGW